MFVAARTLLNQMGLQTPDKILLAGAFGSYIDKTNAMLIGMIPDCPLENVFAVGNSAGDGARIALLNIEKRQEALEVAGRLIHVMNFQPIPNFKINLFKHMNFPHMRRIFPHIADLIPANKSNPMTAQYQERKNE